MRRIQLILAALALVVASFAAFAGPGMAQVVYENTDNYYNQEYAVFGPDGFAAYYDGDYGCYWVYDPWWDAYYWWCD